ncbi:MAG: DUF1592 domain-containing protein [Pseudomonadota bacterium]|nr:DUF1592 domain-containing protein [Pseudomonadota bacterium]
MTLGTLLALASCAPDVPPDASVALRGDAPALSPAAPALRRLTQAQYANVVVELLGEGLVVPTSLEPDTAIDGLYAVGAAVTAISPVGVERYEAAAYSLAEQVAADPSRTATLAGCDPAVDGCLRTFVTTFGRLAWRRTLTVAEVDQVVAIGDLAASTLDDAVLDDGAARVTYALATLLQSPAFLYREEAGEADPEDPTRRRYTSVEMASRLSFFLWNSTPDATLLDAADAGELVTDAGLSAQVERLLADPRAHEGVRAFFTEVLELDQLDALNKDPALFTHMSPEVGPSAREETLLGIEAIVFYDEDWRTFFTTRRAFLDPVLAALYNVPAPTRSGFGEVELADDGLRAGFLGQASFLALQSHPTASSATLRGKFIREILLCQTIPAPPADVDTSIPEADATSPTLRQRIATHLADPTCAACHQLTDPIGLGLENFDGLAATRLTENGATIDASGDLDGAAFADPVDLGAAVAEHDRIGPCLSETLYRYATARTIADGEEALVEWHAAGFEEASFRVKPLLADIATSPGFRQVGELQ